jgi:type I restriction enzyme R subunit
MVVTSSRAAAVRYARAFEKLAGERGMPVRALVAFSGEVPDPDVTPLPGVTVKPVTEASMNPRSRAATSPTCSPSPTTTC